MLATLPTLLTGLLLAAIARHLIGRLIVNKYYPAVEANNRRSKRAAARFEEELPTWKGEEYELRVRILEEEGVSFRPMPALIAIGLVMTTVYLSVSWVVSGALGGPIAESVWWAWPAWMSMLLGWKVFGKKLSQEEPLSTSQLAVVVIGFVLIMAPFAVFFAVAPVGVALFTITSWIVARVLWMVFPYRGAGDLPAAAMVFL